MATISRSVSQSVNTSPFYDRQLRKFAIRALILLFALLLLFAYLLPLGNMLSTSLRDYSQLSQGTSDSIIPSKPVSYNYQGQDYPVYKVPLDSGIKELALVKKARAASQFVDPQDPAAGVIDWKGNWRTLEQVQV